LERTPRLPVVGRRPGGPLRPDRRRSRRPRRAARPRPRSPHSIPRSAHNSLSNNTVSGSE